MAYIKAPRLPWPIEKVFRIGEKQLGSRMEVPRLLLWYPKAFVSSMILEGLVAHKSKHLSKRFLKLIRMQVSIRINCPFCVDMNSHEFQLYNITDKEIEALTGQRKIKSVDSFSYKEKLVLYYIPGLIATPVQIDQRIVDRMKVTFSEKEYAIIITTIAQVAYWTRVIQGFGIQPAGFMKSCTIPAYYKKN